jgi:hypothetical protein
MRNRQGDTDRELTTVCMIFQNVKIKRGYLSLQHFTVFSMAKGSDDSVMSHLFKYVFIYAWFI